MMKRISIFLVVLALLLSGCAATSRSEMPAAVPQESTSRNFGAVEAPAADGGASFGASAGEFEVANSVTSGQGSNGNRLVIRNADLTIVVEDPAAVMSFISQMADDMNGFVVSSRLYKRYTDNSIEVPEANITIRVPADRLNEAMDLIKAQVNDPVQDIQVENVTGQDVTKEYTDLNSRLRNLEQTEQQLVEIQQEAKRTEDILNVYNQITYIREQIEIIKGQIQYYEESAALSSISVLLKAKASVQPLQIGGWQPAGVARDAVQVLIDTLQVIGDAVIWLALYVLPVGLLIFVPLRLIWVFIIRRNRNRRAAPPAPPTNQQAT